MVGRQIASCTPPTGCETPLTPDPPTLPEDLTTVKRKIAGTQSANANNLAYTVDRFIYGPPICPTPRTENSGIGDYLGGAFGYEPVSSLQVAGTSFQEVTWTISSNTINSASIGIYKRAGVDVLATSVSVLYRTYTMNPTCNYEYQQANDYSLELWETTPSASCGCGNCNPPNIDQYAYIAKSATTTGSCGSGATLTFKYIPVAAGDVYGMYITPVTAGWKVEVGSELTISNAAGTTYTFSGTLTSVAAAINATSGGTLFTATVPINISGTVALISDLKPFETDYNQTISCAIGLPLIYSGEELAPSSLCEGPFREVYDFSGPVPLRFDSTAISDGFADTHDGYLSWLRAPRYPKWPSEITPDPDTYWLYDSYNVFAAVQTYLEPNFTYGGVGTFRAHWSLNAGNSQRTYSSSIPPIYSTRTITDVQQNGTLCYPDTCSPFVLDCCVPLPTCTTFPFDHAFYCVSYNVTTETIPNHTQSGIVSTSGYWRFQ